MKNSSEIYICTFERENRVEAHCGRDRVTVETGNSLSWSAPANESNRRELEDWRNHWQMIGHTAIDAILE